MASCNFSDKEMQPIMRKVTDVTCSSLKSAVKCIFEGGIGPKVDCSSISAVSFKSEPTLHAYINPFGTGHPAYL